MSAEIEAIRSDYVGMQANQELHCHHMAYNKIFLQLNKGYKNTDDMIEDCSQEIFHNTGTTTTFIL